MILGGVVAVFFAVDAEGKSLEDVATPLSVIAKPAEAIFRSGGASPGPVPPRAAARPATPPSGPGAQTGPDAQL